MKNKTSECVSGRSARAPSKRKFGSAQPMPIKGQASSPLPDTNASDLLKAAVQGMNTKILTNVDQIFIRTTEDKVRLALNEHWRQVERGRWQRPQDIFNTLVFFVFTFTTSTFHDSLSIKKDTWKAFFMCFAGCFAVSFIRSLWFAITRKPPSVDDLVAQMSGTATGKASKTKLSEDSNNSHFVVGDVAHNPSVISTTTKIRSV